MGAKDKLVEQNCKRAELRQLAARRSGTATLLSKARVAGTPATSRTVSTR